MSDVVLSARGLTKRYKSKQGERTAVDALDVDVRRGVVTGFLGENGAGKTTTLRMFLGLVRPSSGSAVVCGVDVGSGRALPSRKVGALIESPSAWPWLTADEVLRVVARTSGINVDDATRATLLSRVGLDGRGHEAVRGFSLGMKQRLGLAIALLGDPEVLILDEPMNGLDPVGVAFMRELLAALAQEGRTLFVSSHQLNELQQLCADVVIVSKGKKRFAGPMSGLSGKQRVRVRVDDTGKARALLEARHSCEVAGIGADQAIVVDVEHARAPELARALVNAGVGLLALEPVGFDLEAAFLDVVADKGSAP